ncbi:Integrase, catalytic core [Corchorus capsularis]|uniref:Integrase, catalytic core n=1 Tax=Corchorus capsularis TaxID=210143 RepID=A0A1R3HGA1_COCAP|nr:Integrase, catalytic core [Corchorus capsularis]
MANNNSLIPLQVPKLKKDKFDNWCIRMKALLGAHDVWEFVENGYEAPTDLASLSQVQKDLLQRTKKKDKKAVTLIHQALDEVTFEKVSNATTAKEVWDMLQLAYKGMDKAKKIRLQNLRGEFEAIQMKESKKVSDYVSRVTAIANQMKRLGEDVSDLRVIEKILRSAHEEKLNRRKKESAVEHVLQSKLTLKDKEEKGSPSYKGQGRGQYRGRDTGASNHMCGNKDLFAELDEKVRGTITFGDSSKILALVEKESGFKIQALRSDRGGEFTSNGFQEFCDAKGICRLLTTPRSPQQNRVVKRKNRTVLKMTRSMLKTKKMPKEFWAQDVDCAVYLLNKCTTRAVENKTPLEAWSGKKPSVSHLKLMDRMAGCGRMAHALARAMAGCGRMACAMYREASHALAEATWEWQVQDESYDFLEFMEDGEEDNEERLDSITPPPSPSRNEMSSPESSNTEPINFDEAVKDERWRKAMDEEINAIKKNKTWELTTLPKEHAAIGVKSQNKWKIFQMDVKSAFLNGFLEEEVYVEQPPGYFAKGSEGKVLKLKKAFYGLKQAPRSWNCRIDKYFQENGFLKCPYEHALYIKVSGSGILIVCLYVDDLIFTGNNPKMFEEFKRAMNREFEMTDLGLMSYYLGIEVKQMEEGIFITQENYAREVLKKFNMSNCNPVNTPVECGIKLSISDDRNKVDTTLFRSLVGSLRYLISTRADILYGVGLVSRYMESPTTMHLDAAKRILRYIKGTLDFGLFYSTSNDFRLRGFSDSDWGGDIDDRKSTTGFVFYMGDTAFTWSSKKQPIVTLSTCEVEYVALSSCVTQAIWLRSLLKELHFAQMEPTEVSVDSKSIIALAKNPLFHERSKHIDTGFHFVRECVANKVVQLNYVKSQEQVADIFTKALKINDFLRLRNMLGVCKCHV